MTSTVTPTVVFVHGAWHTPANYAPLTTLLSQAGFDVHTPHLPTCNPALQPHSTAADDTAAVRALVTSLADQGRPLIVLMHSYGGVPGTASLRGLSLPQRRAAGLPGGVAQLIYVASYALPPGLSPLGMIQAVAAQHAIPASALQEKFTAEFDFLPGGLIAHKDPHDTFFFPLERGDARVEEGRRHLVPFPMAALDEKVEFPAWREVESVFWGTREDPAVPDVQQEWMWEKARGDAERKVGFEVEVLEGRGHSPFLTQPEVLVEKAGAVWRGVVEREGLEGKGS